jgi:hypothetical protein
VENKMNKMFRKLLDKRILKRIYLERLGEPLIYNLASIYVFLFGTLTKKIDYDLVPRQPYAFGLNEAFKRARSLKIKKINIIEFGVAQGAGLFNLADIAFELSKSYGVDYAVIGFDTGAGMPEPIDFRDHPEKYRTGDYPPGKLNLSNLPSKTNLIYGPISETVPEFLKSLKKDEIISFVSIDVDYYSSTMECFEIFGADADYFLPSTILYFDDVNDPDHNEFMGELLAIKEFNQATEGKKICKMTQLSDWRIFKNALWLDQMYFLHVLDATYRKPENYVGLEPSILTNPYLD